MRERWLSLLVLAAACRSEPASRPDLAVPPGHTLSGEEAAPAIRVDAQPATVAGEAPDDLQEEEKDADPRSRTVTLKLVISPAAQGVVLWGRKKMAALEPGQMKVELERPRNSGPLDLVIRANGFLPHHVRLFSDRDDKLSVRLFRPEETPGLLGYRRAAP